ncbi:radical SAM protein [Clostridia bacterium]|nr:radical SAM protein [Clostridia bacterium]
MKTHKITGIEPNSIAEELGLCPGDLLLSIDGAEVTDVFDYLYLTGEEELLLLVQKADGEEWELEIEKEAGEDLGILFDSGLMDDYKSCSNHCIFCFIDQLPKGMRETLYFKDDDSRLSFLQGNYVTLTNLKEADMNRIIAYQLGPVNISVHTTNPKLREFMLHNRFAGEALKKIEALYRGGVHMNGQIVLCKGVNDKDELERSIKDLNAYLPLMESVSVVPTGLSKYREGLHPLEAFTKEDAIEVIDTIELWQKKCCKTYGTHFIHASDEWYLLAERDLPAEETYDGYLQLENGVGMLRLMWDEFVEALEESAENFMEPAEVSAEFASKSSTSVEDFSHKASKDFSQNSGAKSPKIRISLATGTLAASFIQELLNLFEERYPQYAVTVYPIVNHFFGEQITVSGLLTGADLIEQLKGKDLGERLLLPANLLRSGEEVFLDDVSLSELKETLQVEINMVQSTGQEFLNALINR